MQEKLQRKVWSPNRSWFRINHQTLKDSKIQAFGSGDVQFLTAQEVQNCYLMRFCEVWTLKTSISGNFNRSWRFPESTVQANCRRPNSVSHQWSHTVRYKGWRVEICISWKTKQNWCVLEQRAVLQRLYLDYKGQTWSAAFCFMFLTILFYGLCECKHPELSGWSCWSKIKNKSTDHIPPNCVSPPQVSWRWRSSLKEPKTTKTSWTCWRRWWTWRPC